MVFEHISDEVVLGLGVGGHDGLSEGNLKWKDEGVVLVRSGGLTSNKGIQPQMPQLRLRFQYCSVGLKVGLILPRALFIYLLSCY